MKSFRCTRLDVSNIYYSNKVQKKWKKTVRTNTVQPVSDFYPVQFTNQTWKNKLSLMLGLICCEWCEHKFHLWWVIFTSCLQFFFVFSEKMQIFNLLQCECAWCYHKQNCYQFINLGTFLFAPFCSSIRRLNRLFLRDPEQNKTKAKMQNNKKGK